MKTQLIILEKGFFGYCFAASKFNFELSILSPGSLFFLKERKHYEFGNYKGISLISLGRKLPSVMIPLRLRDAEDKVLREEQCVLGRVEDVSTKFSLFDKQLRSI